jgi:hypothetical protein
MKAVFVFQMEKKESRMRKSLFIVLCLALGLVPLTLAADPPLNFNVQPSVYDPADSDLVQASWLTGLGCPLAARTSTYPATKPTGTFSDPACPTGDPKDKQNQGLLLVKTGPTENNAAAGANINGLPKNTVLSELGYDLRKPASASGSSGSHCGAGAPRFNVQTADGNFYFIGCNSATTSTANGSDTWIRLRWGTGTAGSVMGFNATQGFALQPITSPVVSISIIFDEGTDTGPDNFGAAILDNIDINGVLVGQGPGGPSN